MKLEDAIEMYGCVDYIDQYTGYVYHLSEIKNEPTGIYAVRVTSCDGVEIGVARVTKK